MEWYEVLQTIGAVAAPVLAATATVIGIVSQKSLKRYESALERRNYISQVQFDAEFQIYRELTGAFFDLAKCICAMVPPLNQPDDWPIANEEKLTQDKDRLEKHVGTG
jgi:hypothetical protein